MHVRVSYLCAHSRGMFRARQTCRLFARNRDSRNLTTRAVTDSVFVHGRIANLARRSRQALSALSHCHGSLSGDDRKGLLGCA